MVTISSFYSESNLQYVPKIEVNGLKSRELATVNGRWSGADGLR